MLHSNVRPPLFHLFVQSGTTTCLARTGTHKASKHKARVALNMRSVPQPRYKTATICLSQNMDLNLFAACATRLLWNGTSPKSHSLHIFADYIGHILSHAGKITAPVVYTSLLFIGRLAATTSAVKAQNSEYRICVTALMLADISLNDNGYDTASWAGISGFTIPEVVAMRREFLEAIHYDINISPEEYIDWVNKIKEAVGRSSLNLAPLRYDEMRSRRQVDELNSRRKFRMGRQRLEDMPDMSIKTHWPGLAQNFRMIPNRSECF
jgi:hypothetical protein